MIRVIFLLGVVNMCAAQTDWDMLATTRIKKGIDPYMDEEIDLPDFSSIVLDMAGKEIVLEGYIIPLQQNMSQDFFILSRFPYQSCFFCGGAGPETVVEVFSDRKVKYTDERVRVKGTLQLNPNNPMRLFFIIKNCEVTSL